MLQNIFPAEFFLMITNGKLTPVDENLMQIDC